jgi:hypothetical protein
MRKGSNAGEASGPSGGNAAGRTLSYKPEIKGVATPARIFSVPPGGTLKLLWRWYS